MTALQPTNMQPAAAYTPQASLRQAAIKDPKQAAVCVIDVQNYNCDRRGAIYAQHSAEVLEVGNAMRQHRMQLQPQLMQPSRCHAGGLGSIVGTLHPRTWHMRAVIGAR